MSRVLVVDDRALNREFVATLLRYVGHQVLEAGDGAEALELVRRERPELVISDVRMPVMDGIALARSMHEDAALADIPLIFYTATYRVDEARALAGHYGVREVLAKPAQPQALLDAVDRALGPATEDADTPRALPVLQQRVQRALDEGMRLLGSDAVPKVTSERLVQAYAAVQALSLRLAAVLELGLEVAAERDPDRLLRMFCGAGQNVLNARCVGICVDVGGRRPFRFAVRGLDEGAAAAVARALEPATGLLGQVHAQHRALRFSSPGVAAARAGLPSAHPAVDTLLVVPVVAGSGAGGWMYLADRLDGVEFSADDEQFAVTLASQLGAAYENLMLYDEVQRYTGKLEAEIVERRFALERLGESERRFRQLADAINEVFFLVAPARRRLLYLSPAYQRITGSEPQALYRDLASWLDLVHAEDRARVEREVLLAQPSGQFDSEFRIVRPDGAIRWLQLRGFPVLADDGTLQRIAGVAEDITERHEHEAGIARLTRIHAVLSGINSAIVRIRDRDELLDESCRIAVEEGVFVDAFIAVVDAERPSARIAAASGAHAERLHGRCFACVPGAPVAQTACRALEQRRAVIINDLRSESPHLRQMPGDVVIDCEAMAAFPLLVDGRATAVLVLCAAEAGFFDEEELVLLRELAGDIAFGLQYIAKEESLNYLAFYDALTGLANSSLFLDRLTQFLHNARPARERVAVFVIDLERFTQLNDTFGRQIGDALLQRVADRLNHALDEPFSVARIGADTFAVAVGGLRRRADVGQILHEQLLRPLELPFRVEGVELQLSAKAGVALYPGDGDDALTLFTNAEAALKQAQGGSERFLYYARQMNAEVAEKVALEARLRRALEREQFQLYYQPKVAASNGRIVGFEALVRWDDPERGLMGPAHFVPLLEETGLVRELGEWAVQRALADHRRWSEAGLRPPRVAVNVSALQLHRHDYADSLLAAIAASGVGAEALELEVTEGVIIQDFDAGARSLERLRRAGVSIAIDDFGTGYSSLRYLARLPLDALKVDRSFVITMLDDPASRAIVAMIVSLAHALQLSVVAEGVDDPEQAAALVGMGCDVMQGFLYSVPVPAAAVADLLRGDQRIAPVMSTGSGIEQRRMH